MLGPRPHSMTTPIRTVVLALAAAERARIELEQIPEITVVERYEVSSAHDDEALLSGLDGAWAVIAGGEAYTRGVLEAAAPELKAILRWGTGSDAIDIPAATDAGVAVVTTPGVNAEAVADMALALMLACLRGLPALDAAVRSGEWRATGPTRDLAGATVGVVGLGAIGRAVTRRVRAFGCHVLAVEPNPDLEFVNESEVELTDLDAMLPQVDVLTLHAPLGDTSRRLLGARELALLPRHAVLVNTARGELDRSGRARRRAVRRPDRRRGPRRARARAPGQRRPDPVGAEHDLVRPPVLVHRARPRPHRRGRDRQPARAARRAAAGELPQPGGVELVWSAPTASRKPIALAVVSSR